MQDGIEYPDQSDEENTHSSREIKERSASSFDKLDKETKEIEKEYKTMKITEKIDPSVLKQLAGTQAWKERQKTKSEYTESKSLIIQKAAQELFEEESKKIGLARNEALAKTTQKIRISDEKISKVIQEIERETANEVTFDQMPENPVEVLRKKFPNMEEKEIYTRIAQEKSARDQAYIIGRILDYRTVEEEKTQGQFDKRRLAVNHRALELANLQRSNSQFLIRATEIRLQNSSDETTQQAIENLAHELFEEEYQAYQNTYQEYEEYRTKQTNKSNENITAVNTQSEEDREQTLATQMNELGVQLTIDESHSDGEKTSAKIVHQDFEIPIMIEKNRIIMTGRNFDANTFEIKTADKDGGLIQEQIRYGIHDYLFFYVIDKMERDGIAISPKVKNLEQKYSAPLLKTIFGEKDGKIDFTKKIEIRIKSLVMYLNSENSKQPPRKLAENLSYLTRGKIETLLRIIRPHSY